MRHEPTRRPPLPAPGSRETSKDTHAPTVAQLDHLCDAVRRDWSSLARRVASPLRLHAASSPIAGFIWGPFARDPVEYHVLLQVESRVLALHRDCGPQRVDQSGVSGFGDLLCVTARRPGLHVPVVDLCTRRCARLLV